MNNAFRPVDWAHSTNIYEVNTRQYTSEGTFNSFAKELDRLRDMGVETLWFMPIHPIGIKNRKGSLGSYYSISNYRDTNSEFGTVEDFKNLVDKAHTLGFKILIDWVANHTAWDHVWTQSHPDFFSKDEHGNFRPPFPDWEDVIHLNYDNRDLWTKMIDDMRFWVEECNIDGFRCDMAHLVPLEFWRAARTELDKIRPSFWMAETEESRYHEVFEATYTWEFLHKMEAFWRKETLMEGLDSVLLKYNTLFPAGAMRLFFTSNHDENSHSGSEYERMGSLAKAFAVFCTTWNGIPLIYSGQELPNTKRLRFFEKDTIEWTGSYELHGFYKTLLNLHSSHPAMRTGDEAVSTERIHVSDEAQVLAFIRRNGEREIFVVLNLLREIGVSFFIASDNVNGVFKDVFTGAIRNFDADRMLMIPPGGYLVFEK